MEAFGVAVLADHPPALYHTPESGQLYFLKAASVQAMRRHTPGDPVPTEDGPMV